MKIAILIPVHGREEVAMVCEEALRVQLRQIAKSGILAVPFCIPSKYDGELLGSKLNDAVQWMAEYDWDFLMVLGSDDLLRPQIWGYIRTAIDEGLDFFGFNECAVYDRINHKAKTWNHGPNTIGAARCISRKLVEACDWVMWDNDRMNGIDSNQEAIVFSKTKVYPHIIPTLRPVICDIKDGDNLNSFDDVPGIEANVGRIRKDFPALEAWPLPAKNSELWVTTTTAGAV